MKNEWISIEEPISLKVRRCYKCGSFWAVDQMNAGEYVSGCPVCLRADWVRADERAEAAERRVRALRGALTKRKKRG